MKQTATRSKWVVKFLRGLSVVFAVIVGLCLILSILLATGVVGITLPRLTGSYKVGKLDYTFVDPSRKETFITNSKAARQIAVTVYYPALVSSNAQVAPYIDHAKVADVLAGRLHMPAFLANIVHAHAYMNVQAANGSFPLVLFSPGIGNSPTEYTSEVEDLAGHGYIVAALYHTYSVPATPLVDGSVAVINDAGIRSENEPAGTSDQQTNQDRNAIGTVWTKDVQFALDQLTQLNAIDPTLKGHIDLNEVGMYGHSFGGATTAEVLSTDPRFKAGINMDGETFAMTNPSQIKQPFLWMASDYSQVTNAQLQGINMSRQDFDIKLQKRMQERNQFMSQIGSNDSVFVLKHSTHNTYATDDAIIGRVIPGLSDPLATVDPMLAVNIIDQHVSDFFDAYLK